MLVRIATHADILGAAEVSARHQLIQTLCQPFFEQAVATLSGEISNLGTEADSTLSKPASGSRPTLNFGQRLGFLEEDSTDAETDSAFATLFSSDGEDESEGELRLDQSLQPAQFGSGFGACDDDSESNRDDEKSQMVCRHWKSKGWCRYESQCKFLHPANKCGVSAKVLGEDSDVPLPHRSTRRRGGKNKKPVVALDSRINLVDSYSMCPPFFVCQGMH
jgi:hypothetical protein